MTTEVLTTEECLRLLRTQHVGRLAVMVDGYPMVFPVNFGLDGGTIVFRAGAGTKLTAAQHRNVGFEVDEVDQLHHTAWSVLVNGMAEIVTGDHDQEIVQRSRHLRIEPMAEGPKDHWVRILPSSTSGRRISREHALDLRLSAAYL